MNTFLVTGSAGFIGSNYCRYLLKNYPNCKVVGLDALTYAGNLSTMHDLKLSGRFRFYPGRIQDECVVAGIIQSENVDTIVNFAAESHNDRSLMDASSFIQTDVAGVAVLLEATRKFKLQRMLHVSTDEVYGSVADGRFTEQTPIAPNTPYSASKAGGDLQARAHHIAYGTPVIVTRCGNNFGPFQYPEKLLPFFISRLIDHKKVPLYGDGSQVRDWVYVDDHCSGIDYALRNGTPGEVYNIGSDAECTNLEITHMLLSLLDRPVSLIHSIEDPRGGAHDKRYSIDASKLKAMGWTPTHPFTKALESTVRWYLEHETWWREITSKPDYITFVKSYYGRYLQADL